MKITTDRKVLLAISALLIIFVLSGAFLGRIAAVEGTYRSLKVFQEALTYVVNNYVHPVEIDTLMEGSYRGLLESLDPSNEYLSEADYNRASRGELAGPAEIGLTLSKQRGYIAVVAVADASPAGDEGLRTGDLLISIDGKSSRHMGVWGATQALRGEPGTEVTLIVNSPGSPERRTTVPVRKILTPPVPTGAFVEPDVGVVRIGAIRKGDARRLDRVIASLKAQGADRLLLDLRGCSSDNLAESIGMVSLFVDDGIVVTVTDRYDGDKAYRTDGRRVAWDDAPLTVLIDGGTARTCEVLAAALRDELDTSLVGEVTWGIGSLHALLPLANGSGVFLAVGRFLSPDGRDWNGNGLEPDHEIDAEEETDGELDVQRSRAIDYLRGIALPGAEESA